MQIKVSKVDKRYKAYGTFDYFVEPNKWPLGDNYLELREWFWENYGPGCDINTVCVYNPPERTNNYKWAWQDDEYRLFLKDGPELAHLQLKWS